MGLLNIKKTLAELKEAEQGNSVDISEQEDPKEYTILERGALDVAALVAPESFAWEENYCKVGDDYTRTLWIHTYPPQVEDNWLAGLLRFNAAVDVSLYIQPLPIKPFLTKLRQQVAHDEAAVTKEEDSGLIPNQKRVARLRDNEQFIGAIEEDITKPFQVMVAMTIRAKSVEDLDKITELLETTLSNATTRSARHRHKQGFETTMPLMTNELADMQSIRSMHTQGLMSMFPFTSSDISHDSGVLVGVSQMTNSPIIINRFMQPEIESPNTAILGASGSGKSYFAKVEMLRWAYHGIPTIVLDPSGEYTRVCEGLGGANITISLDSDQVINPLDFSNAVRPGHNALREKLAFLVELLRVMLRDEGNNVIIDAVTKQIFENALQEVYRRYGYLVDDVTTQERATSQNMPVLSEVVVMLARIAKTNRDPMIQQRVRPMLAAIGSFVGDGHLAPLFDRRTTIDLHSHFVNFNYQGLSSQYLPMAMHLVLEFLRTSYFTEAQQESGQHRLLYVDEAQVLMQYPETAHFLEYSARQCRKFGIGLTVMTQNVGVFVLNDDGSDNKTGQGILANCPIKVLLKQQPNEAEAIQRAFHLTQGELARLLSSRAGEGLIFVGEETGWFSGRGLASVAEHEMLTTTMSERAEISQRQNQAEAEEVGQISYQAETPYHGEEEPVRQISPSQDPFEDIQPSLPGPGPSLPPIPADEPDHQSQPSQPGQPAQPSQPSVDPFAGA